MSAAGTTAAPARHGFGRLARDSALYAMGSVVGKVVGLAILPVLTRTLTTEDYGRYDVLSTLQSAATSVLLLGLDVAATRLYVDLRDDERRRMFSTWAVGLCALLLPTVAVFVMARSALSSALFDQSGLGLAVALTGVSVAGSALQLVGLTALRNHRRPVAFAMISGGGLLLNGLLIVVLVLRSPTVTSVLVAMAVSLVVGATASLFVAAPYLAARPSASMGARLLRLGLPLAPAVALTWVAEFANRAILLDRSGPSQVAFFSVASRFASISMLVVLGFQLAWQPEAFGAGASSERLERVAADGRRITVGVTATAVLLALCGPELIRLVSGAAYLSALPALGFSLVFSIAFSGYHTATMPSAISARMRDLGLSAAIAAAAGVVLNLAWASRWGSVGTAAAIATGQILGLGAAIGLARLRAPVPFRWDKMALVSVTGGACALAATLPSGGAAVMTRIGLGVVFLAVLWFEGSLLELRTAVRSAARRPPTEPRV